MDKGKHSSSDRVKSQAPDKDEMDAIGRDTCVRYVISGSIRISTIVDDGRDKG